MANQTELAHLVRFGEFELDLRSGELRTDGHHLILQEKPFQVLTALLEQPGEMVTREELIRRLWPAGTFVDFNLGLNKAVNRLREALADTAEGPRFIETFPKRGYRFVAEVHRNGAGLAELPSIQPTRSGGSASGQPPAIPRTSRRRLFPLGVSLSLACLLGAWLWIRHPEARPVEPVFERLSFGRGTILSARFAPDGKGIVYGAAWDGKPTQLFSSTPGSSESRPLGVEADILAVSPSGEMAILLKPTFRLASRRGTLALISPTGGAFRKLLDNVQDADWSPDGSKLAVTHYVDGRYVLEFPLGKALYKTTGGTWLSHPRISPHGDQITFIEHPLGAGDDDGGWVAVTDLAGHKKTLSGEFGSVSGVAWDPGANTVWFSASEVSGGPTALFRVMPGEQQRLVRRESGNMTLHDVSRDDHLLLTRDTIRSEVFGRISPEKTDHELGWGNNSLPTDISPDAATLLLSVQGEASGSGFAVYLRKTDGSSATRLGDGLPVQLSSDGKWAITIYPSGIKPGSPPQLLLLPTSIGQPVTLTRDSIDHGFAALSPDGTRILFEGSEPGHATRNWIQDVPDGKPVPITPEGTFGKRSSNAKLVVAMDTTEKFWLYSTDGSPPRALSGIQPGEEPIRLSNHGKYLFVAPSDGMSVSIYRIEVSTGRRQFVSKIVPGDPAGLWNNLWPIVITPDGKSYAYCTYRVLSDLYLANGLR